MRIKSCCVSVRGEKVLAHNLEVCAELSEVLKVATDESASQEHALWYGYTFWYDADLHTSGDVAERIIKAMEEKWPEEYLE